MSADSAIADVGETLIKLLREHMGDMVTPKSIALQSPADVTGHSVRLTLFLFRLAENPYLKNQAVDPAYGYTRLPPLSLDLYYMLSAYSYLPDFTERSLEEHRLLGRAMRVFHDHAVLAGELLQGGLAGSGARLSVTYQPSSVQEASDIWNTFPDSRYKPTVCYAVSPVEIDTTTVIAPSRVTAKEVRFVSLEKEQ
ncbi:MAG: DUF4255 domain-containing protein [Bacillota bacterium]